MFELYHSPVSTCSQKVRLVLAEKGLDYVDRRVNFAALEHLSPEYLALNPGGVVPTLVHDGVAVTDSSVICEYLDEVVPDPPLSGPDALGRASVRAWMRFLEEVPTAAIRVPSFNKVFTRRFRAMGDAAFAAMTARMPLRRQFYEKMGQDGFDEAVTRESVERLRAAVERVDGALASGSWLAGERYTLADIVYTPTVVRMDDLCMAEMWADRPRFAAWYDRIRARPAFDVAYMPGSRLDPASFQFEGPGRAA